MRLTSTKSPRLRSTSVTSSTRDGFDLVIAGGRVIDPETCLDDIRNVGIHRGRISAVTTDTLTGAKVIAAGGRVVAPGFIDLHSHSQSVAELRLQAFDGVTTALELEAGAADVAATYAFAGREGRPINYGFSASWAAIRKHALSGEPLESRPAGASSWLGSDIWRGELSVRQGRVLLEVLERELTEGALGIGILLGYAPRTSADEYVRIARLAAAAGVPTYTHARPLIEQDPNVVVDGADELVRVAGETGAHMHYCHINSTSGSHLDRVHALVGAIRAEGARVTTETYPYGAGMTPIGSEYFHPDRLHLIGATGTPSDVIYARTGETVASVERLLELRAADPGGLAFIRIFDEDSEPDRLTRIATLPGAVAASDAAPLVVEHGHRFDPAQWPLPGFVKTHPRTAGTFSRTLRIAVRESGRLTLSEAIARCSLYPARIVESAAPDLGGKGRVQVGCDADLVVFDADTVTDSATYADPLRPSIGFDHVIVNGESVVSDGELRLDAMPGRPVRGSR